MGRSIDFLHSGTGYIENSRVRSIIDFCCRFQSEFFRTSTAPEKYNHDFLHSGTPLLPTLCHGCPSVLDWRSAGTISSRRRTRRRNHNVLFPEISACTAPNGSRLGRPRVLPSGGGSTRRDVGGRRVRGVVSRDATMRRRRKTGDQSWQTVRSSVDYRGRAENFMSANSRNERARVAAHRPPARPPTIINCLYRRADRPISADQSTSSSTLCMSARPSLHARPLKTMLMMSDDDEPSVLKPNSITLSSSLVLGWLRGPAVENRSLAGVLSLSCVRLVADG